MSQEYVLEYSLEAVGVPSPETAKIRFTLTNSGKDSLRILPWNTPFSGAIYSKRMFSVKCKVNGGEEDLRFEGVLLAESKGATLAEKQNGDESWKDAIWLGPGQSREAVVDLASAYKLPPKGECNVAFTGLITVVVEADPGPNKEPKLDFTHARGEPLLLPVRA
jgi:hypothetical protein